MAIQVSGSTVIHDSQDVQVSGMFTASSFVGDASQLTNLPASGGTLEATASGTLSDGSTVIVNADGTVSVVAQTETTGPGLGSQGEFNSLSSVYISAAYDSTNNKVVIAYADWGNSNYGTAVVGTVSGTSISFGSPVVFESATTTYTTTVYDSTNQKIVIGYVDSGNSNYGTAIVGTVSGTSISFGSPVVFNSANTNTSYISGTFDSTNSKIVIAYTNTGNSDYGTAIVGTVSGTSISFGSSAVFESDATYSINATYDSTNQKVVIAYRDWNNSERGTAVVGTVSGTSISFGSPVTFGSTSGSQYPTAVYDSTNNRVVISYRDKGNSYYGTAVVGTVSGTSISFGTPVVFESGQIQYIGATFDSASGKVVIAYNDTSNGQYGTAIVGTVDPSNNSITFGSYFVFNADLTYWNSPIFDSTNNKVVIAHNSGTGSVGKASVFGNTGFTLPSLGSPIVYSTANTSGDIAYDPSSNKIVIAYSDGGNSSYGTAVVGTVSGTSISFGTPVVFEAATSPSIAITYTTSGKVVIAYKDDGSSGRGTAVVGEVSGTSISFGTPGVFTSNDIYETAITYDSSNDRVVIAFTDMDNSYRTTSVIGQISGTSINFSGLNTFDYGVRNTVTYDSTNNKVVFVYRDEPNADAGTVKVGTVNSGSLSYGSAVVFTSDANYMSSAYDSTNQKIVIAYHDGDDNGYGKAIVGTVSGDSISFGTPVVFNYAHTRSTSMAYDSTNGKIIIGYQDWGNNFYGTAIVGTVSGTSISFGTPIVFESANTSTIKTAYDSTNDQTVIIYRDAGNSYYGTAIIFNNQTLSTNLTAENYIGISNGAYTNGQTATIQVTGSVDDAQSGLTAGQAYYVQDDGTLGESGSVFAGTAVSASKIIVKG